MHVARMLLILFGAIVLMFMIFEKSFIFHPQRKHDAVPSAWGLPFENADIEANDGTRLHGWFLPRSDSVGTLLYLHGNAGNISHRLDKARRLHHLGLQILLIDYRGYGHSRGRPSEVGTYRDAHAAWQWLIRRKDVDPSRIVCFGESLGGAVAIDLATKEPCRALIVESSFTSIRDLAKDLFPLLPLRFLIATKYNSLEKIKSVSAPALFIHGTADDLIPIAHGHRLFAAARKPKDHFWVPQAGHNDVSDVAGPNWSRRIGSFLEEALRGNSSRLSAAAKL